MNANMAPRAARATALNHDGVFLGIAYGWALVVAGHSGRLVQDIDNGMLVMTAQPTAESGA